MNKDPSVRPRNLAPITAVVIIALVPFHAFLTVWAASNFGHYTAIRLWKEYLLVIVLAAALYKLAMDRSLLKKFFSLLVVRLIFIYALLLVIRAAVGYASNDVSSKAAWYGLLVDLRFLIFFMAVMVLAAGKGLIKARWKKLLLIPSVLVVALAILQYLVLPYDFLRHFGYGDNTIGPYETINHNINHIRVMSTLRGANPLGAYLIVPLSAVTVLLLKERRERLDKLIVGAGLLLALIFSFSRSAWIGAVIAVLAAIWLGAERRKSTRRITVYTLAALVITGALLAGVLRNNLAFQNAVLHTDRNSKAAVSSNEGHITAFEQSADDLVKQPLGDGVGSAGPQSFYNNHPARIAENYFLQIGQEAGVLGMVLFIAICVLVGKMLFRFRDDPLALALFASLVGLTFVNLLSHAWEDDTLAYVWWGLAAIACSPAIITDRLKDKNGKKTIKAQKNLRPVR